MPKGRQKGSPPSTRERHVARAISVLRRAQDLGQAELAEQAELATDTIGRLERVKFSPSLNTLFQVADGLGLSLVTVLLAAELVEREGSGWLFQILGGLEVRAIEDKVARLSRARGLRGEDE